MAAAGERQPQFDKASNRAINETHGGRQRDIKAPFSAFFSLLLTMEVLTMDQTPSQQRQREENM